MNQTQEPDFATAQIWTKDGNRLESELDFSVHWDVDDSCAKITETWRDKATGEIVKQSAHGYMFKGVAAEGAVGSTS